MTISNIEWTDITDNIIHVIGGGHWCRKISPGCAHCYAEALNKNPFFGGNGLPYSGKPPQLGLRFEIIEGWARMRKPKKHFVASMTDIFGEWVKRHWQFMFLDGMLAAPLQTFQLLTKRAHVMLEAVVRWMHSRGLETAPANIWLGFTAENQEEFDRRWAHMKPLAMLGFTIFVSCEPLLGPITLPPDFLALGRRAQVIVGGESGKKARPMHPDWARQLRDQCSMWGVAFFFKQWGAYIPSRPLGACNHPSSDGAQGPIRLLNPKRVDIWRCGMCGALHDLDIEFILVGKKEAGRVLDGRTWNEFPESKA